MEIYYFTGTGNSLSIAKKIEEVLEEEVILKPLEKFKEIEKIIPKSETVGFIFPIYFGDIPKFVKNILKKFDLSNTKYVFAIPNCYGLVGGAINNLKKILKNSELKYINVVHMPDNAILFPIEKDKEKLEKSKDEINTIIDDLRNRKEKKEFSVNTWQKFIYYIMKGTAEIDFSPKRFRVNEKCIGCGICVEVCPCNNIKLIDKKPKFYENCAHCLSCFHLCPEEAIYMKNFTIRNRRRYKNPDVDLKELFRK